MDIGHLSQFLTPEVEIILFGAANFVATWLGSKVHKDAGKVFAFMTPIIAVLYVSTTFDWSQPLAPQLGAKFALVFFVSTGIWKWWRDQTGKTEKSRQALIEHGKNLANAENQATVTVIPVQSDTPVIVGDPVQVQTNQPVDQPAVIVQVPSDSSAINADDGKPLSPPPSSEQL